jgi:chromosome segregation ATPase
MCHKQLNLQLSHCTIVRGDGGCGKSAILSALDICFDKHKWFPLGCNARAKKYQQYIRYTASSCSFTCAEITVKLVNTERDGYQYGVYGPSITVTRVLGSHGMRCLQMISDANEVVSRSEEEVSNESYCTRASY